MRIVSFNVNGIRARLHQLETLVEQYQPDIIGLQETKVDDPLFPVDAVEALGYNVHFHGQKGHYGVALLSKHPANDVQKGFDGEAADAQRRWISAKYEVGGQRIEVCNGYFPQGENRSHPTKFPNKAAFYENTVKMLEQRSPDNPLIVMGDLNISYQDTDIGIGEKNAKRWLQTGKCSFLPEERAWLKKMFDWGLTDTFRHHHPDTNDRFSWFDYRSRGFQDDPKRGLRIDAILATRPLIDICQKSGISYTIREMDKPSDHCPVWADFDI